MTNEELLSVAEIVERATNRFNEQAARFRERSAAYDRLIAEMSADHEAKMAEHRASFGARTEADRQIIEGLRADVEDLRNRLNALGIQAAKQAGEALGMVEGEGLLGAARRVVKERDGLLTQVQDMRAEIERLQWENKTMQKDAEDGYAEAIKVLGDPIALSKERDALRAEVADLRGIVDMVHASLGIKRGDHIGKAIEALKSQSTPTPKRHPVKVGEWVKRTTRPYEDTPIGSIGQVAIVNTAMNSYRLDSGQRWSFEYCEPCDPPADHDTPAGKEAAKVALLSGEIKVGDERDGLLTQVQDMRAEIERLQWENKTMHKDAEDGYAEAIKVLGDPIGLSKERDALLAEVAELKTKYSKLLGVCDFIRSYCEPCDPPPEASHITPEGKQTAEGALPQPGDVVRLVRVPTNDEYPHDSGRWEPNWGGIGDYMRVHYVGSNINGTRVVRAVFGLEWPLSCVEVVKGGDK